MFENILGMHDAYHPTDKLDDTVLSYKKMYKVKKKVLIPLRMFFLDV